MSEADNQILKFDKETIKQLRESMAEALAVSAEDLSVRFAIGPINYGTMNCSMKVEVFVETVTTALQTSDQILFEQHCRRYGFRKDQFGTVFEHDDKRYKLKCFKTSNKKYPVLAYLLGPDDENTGRT